MIEAPSTRIRIFLKTHLFLSVLGSRLHGEGVFSHQKRSCSKTLSSSPERIDSRRIRACAPFFGDHARAFCLSVFFHRSLNAEYRYRLWNFVIEYRIVSVTAFSCGRRGYFRKRSSCGRGSFFKRIKMMRFQKYRIYVWTGPEISTFFLYSIKSLQDELPITIPTNYSTKHYKDDNTTGSNRL